MAELEFKIPQKKYTKESVVISSRIPKDMLREIDGIASKTGRSRNEILMLSLEFALRYLKIEEIT